MIERPESLELIKNIVLSVQNRTKKQPKISLRLFIFQGILDGVS